MLSSTIAPANSTSFGTTSEPSASKNAGTDPAAAQDRFLKLLVAQLNNQDPMNPMDNAQMTSQMAQINTVTGIQQVNQTLKSMADQFASLQVLQGASMVGRDVLVDGSKLKATDGVAKGAIDLSGRADSVKIEILSPSGAVLGTVNLGALEAGRHNFEWDATSYSGSGDPSFRVTATRGTQSVATTPMTRDRVVSVSSENGAMSVQLRDHHSVAYSSIKAIL
ncbi:flagellar hook assembly protein FlgD [Rhodoferax sp.]|uniref:flagellar hook assembly protein FlgD n=1 Tax=Rhodoferax sp. TaxID=50421 RepID=UPI00274643DF|nr:flagellar hook capping FlgD N-terminal domain-containing protein [Rhodoferax sp.]